MQKIAAIFSFKMSNWLSCQKIVFNLHKAYQMQDDSELLNFNFSSELTHLELLQTAQKIVEADPDVILILDHKPHPHSLLKMLVHRMEKSKKKPRFIFHIFGDFTLYYPQWSNLEKILKGFPVEFVVASDRQKHLIDKFLAPFHHSYVCPFPVSRQEFFYDPPLRAIQRREWELKEDDMAYVFTGRLSRQKKIHTLLRAFADFLVRTGTVKAHLYLYGNPDNVGDPFLARWETEGEYFRKISRIYKNFPDWIQKQIHFMGSVPNSELSSVYHGADILVNLSVHNDEDFGMSVAEAQCCGLASILTDWGGLSGFQQEDFPEATNFIPVKIGKYSKLVHYKKFVSALEASFVRGASYDRNLISSMAQKRFSIEAAAARIRQLIQSDSPSFVSFSSLFQLMMKRIRLNMNPYLTSRKTISKLYRELYSSYVRDH